MAKLGERDWLKLLAGIRRLHDQTTVQSLAATMLDVAQSVIACDHCSYDEVDLVTRTTAGICSDRTVDESWPSIEDAAAAYFHQHPVLHYFRAHPHAGARRISDFISPAAFHETGLYRECYRHIGVAYQLVTRLPGQPNVEIGLALSRQNQDFSDRDKQCLNLLRPHLHQAYRRCIALRALETRSDTATAALDALPQGFIMVNAANQILLATARAQQQLPRYFKADPASAEPAAGTCLPAELSYWLNQRRQQASALFRAVPPLVIRTDSGELTITATAAEPADACLLCLDERRTVASAMGQLRGALNLTTRQAQVLYWVARGKTNREIARHLHVSPRTIQKHLEHVFATLGVATRTEAATRAFEAMNRP